MAEHPHAVDWLDGATRRHLIVTASAGKGFAVTRWSPEHGEGARAATGDDRLPVKGPTHRDSMHIYLIRHAHAEEGIDDALRPLSKKGLRQIRSMGRFLRERGAVEAKVFWHSPLVRAVETAERLAKRLQSPAKLHQVSGIRPQDDPHLIARKLGDLHSPVAVVGHDPHLSGLASLLVCGNAEPPRFVLKKCSVIRLDRSSRGWSVRWQVSPELV